MHMWEVGGLNNLYSFVICAHMIENKCYYYYFLSNFNFWKNKSMLQIKWVGYDNLKLWFKEICIYDFFPLIIVLIHDDWVRNNWYERSIQSIKIDGLIVY